MRPFSASVLFPVLLAFFAYKWLCIQPRVDWKPSGQTSFESCPPEKKPFLIFGATSMLGKYIVQSFREQQPDICIISFARSKCKQCHVDVAGDLRDIRLVERVLKYYKPDTVLTSVKPPLLDIHYKTYIELNLLSMVQLIDSAKANGVSNFIYVSSIAASGHYFDHHMSKETDLQPYYTDYEAPYDVSKRFSEDHLLQKHEDGKFNVIAIRVSGIIGGTGDPYDYMRWPILGGFKPDPPLVDSNYAGNIADALVVIYKRMEKDQKEYKNNTSNKKSVTKRVSGTFYYYTGESLSETEKIKIVADQTGKPLILLPKWILEIITEIWHWARLDPLTYTWVDLLRMGLVSQTFDQTKFRTTFPEFKERMTMEQALRQIYGKDVES